MKDLQVKDPIPPTKRIHKLVLTGGPCGGKTTGQAHLATFFESLGWKVFRVPETATVLMSGGISFGELNEEQILDFQEHLVATMMALEDTYFSMAEKCSQNVLIIADRGTMDASAFISREAWEKILNKLGLEDIEISDNRYNHIVHMQSAAIGAEKFYTTEDHAARFEGIELARERDNRAMEAWRDHPYVDIIDNRSDFDSKINRLIDLVVKRIGINVGDRFNANSQGEVCCVRNLSRFRLSSQVYGLSGCPPLPSLCPERFPDEVEEESKEWKSHVHLHSAQARATRTDCRTQAAHLTEGLQ